MILVAFRSLSKSASFYNLVKNVLVAVLLKIDPSFIVAMAFSNEAIGITEDSNLERIR